MNKITTKDAMQAKRPFKRICVAQHAFGDHATFSSQKFIRPHIRIFEPLRICDLFCLKSNINFPVKLKHDSAKKDIAFS